jgi:hypothetical protein
MGIFGGIKDTYKKSEAAVVVQNLLEHQVKVGFYELNHAKVANQLVEYTWNKMPDIYGGKFGQRPHKLTVAASALINGISLASKDDVNRTALITSLRNLLAEIDTNGEFYPFNSLDHKLLEKCSTGFIEVMQEYSDSEPEDLEEPEIKYNAAQEVRKYLKIMGYDLSDYGIAVALLEVESGYSEVEAAAHLAYTTMALDIRESGNNIVRLMSFVPHATELMKLLSHYKDEGLMRSEQCQNDVNAIFGIVTVGPDQVDWLEQVLKDPIAGKERVALSRIDYSD